MRNATNQTRDTHGNHANNRITKINQAVIDGSITPEQYQSEAQQVLRGIRDWQKRQHYENLCILPVGRTA